MSSDGDKLTWPWFVGIGAGVGLLLLNAFEFRNTRTALEVGQVQQVQECDRLTIDTQGVRIHALGNAAALEQHGAYLLERLSQVDPAILRPGMGLWVAPHGDKPEDLVLVGRITSTEPITPAGAHSATPGDTPKESNQ
jgi:hypothetical protein